MYQPCLHRPRYALSAAVLSMSLGLSIPAIANDQTGVWDPQFNFPLIPIHAVLTPAGKVLSFGSNADGSQGGRLYYAVWSPALGTGAAAHKLLANQTSTDIFCATQVLLPGTGKALVMGGDNGYVGNVANSKTTLYDDATDNMTNAGFTMAFPRWYPTALTLPDGNILIQGGRGDGNPAPQMTTPEVFNPAQGWRSLFGARSDYAYGGGKWFYPRAWVLPNGNVFGISEDAMYYLNWTGDGILTNAGAFTGGNRGNTSTAVMYSPGKLLQVGGGRNADGSRSLGSRAATRIDVTGAAPVLSAAPNMAYPRHWGTSTVLPNGQVLVTGGSEGENNLDGAGPSLRAELYDPGTNTWKTLAAENQPRLYHSTAVLLPDATVLSAGGGAPGPVVNKNGQIFRPPYLYSGTAAAVRPGTSVASTNLAYGGTVAITVNSVRPIARVTLVKTGAVTHSFNNDQRFLELPFTRGGNTVTATVPGSTYSATPGYYLLFVLDDKGVPSIGKIMHLAPATAQPVNLVRDGSFETVAVGAGGAVDFSANQAFGNWTVYSGTVSVQSNTHRNLGAGGASGANHMDLNGNTIGAAWQAIGGLTAGATYALTFDYAKHDMAGERAYAAVQIAAMRKSFTATNLGNANWMQATYAFTARSASENLYFYSEGGNACCGMLIDDVTISKIGNPIPAPVVNAYAWNAGTGGLTLNGTNQYGSIAHNANQNLSRSITLAARVNGTAFDNYDGIITKGTTASPYALRVLADGRVSFNVNWGNVPGAVGGGDWFSTLKLKTGTWQHVAATYDGARIRFFIDGVQDTYSPAANITFGSNAEPLIIGCDYPGAAEWFSGKIADAKLFNAALTVEQIQALAYVKGPQPAGAVVDLYPWNNGTGGISLDGSTQFQQTPHTAAMNASRTLTLAARIKADQFRPGDGIVVKGSSNEPFGLALWDNRSLRFTANWGNPAGSVISGAWNSAASLTQGTWHHVAVTYDGTNIRFYIDGVPGDYQPASGITFGTNAEPLYIGVDKPGAPEYFDGNIADVKMYTRALTTAEIRALAGVP